MKGDVQGWPEEEVSPETPTWVGVGAATGDFPSYLETHMFTGEASALSTHPSRKINFLPGGFQNR